MAEVVDSIIAELILKSQGYAEGFDAATAAHGRFRASVDALKGQTFDLSAEAQKYKGGLDQIADGEEQTTARVVRTRKARTDAVKQAASEEVSAEKSAADAKLAIARDVAAEQERLRTQELTARRRAALQAFQDARQSSSSGPTIVEPNAGRTITQADYDAALARTEAARAAVSGPGPVSRVSNGAQEEVAAQKEVNQLAIDYALAVDKSRNGTQATRKAYAEIADELRFIQQLQSKGASDEAIAVALEERVERIEAKRVEDAEKLALASRASPARRFGVGGANDFAREATGGRLRGIGPGALAGAAIIGGGAIVEAASNYGKELTDTSQELGVSTRDLQTYQAMAMKVGVTNEQLATSFGTLGDKLSRARDGDQALQKVFKGALNIDISKFKTAGDALPTVIDRLTKITDKEQRAAIGTNLFGTSYRKLDSILAGGNAKIEAFGKAMGDSVLTDAQIQALNESAAAIDQVKQQLLVDFSKTVANNKDAIIGLAGAVATLTGKILELASAHPQETLAAAGAYFGARSFGLPGAIAGAAGGLVLGDTIKQEQADSNNDPAFRLKQAQDARDKVLRLRASPINPADKSDALDAANRELVRQRGLLDKARATAIPHTGTAGVQAGDPSAQGIADAFAPKPPKGKSADTLAREAAARAKRADDEEAQFNDSYLESLQALATSTDERYRLAAASLQTDHDRRQTDISLQVKEHQIDASREQELKAANDLAYAGKLAVLAAQKRAEQLETINALQEQQVGYERDHLQSQSVFARTSSDRLKNRLDQIDLAQSDDRDQSIRTLFDLNASDRDKQLAGNALRTNQSRFDDQRAVARKEEQGPLADYYDKLPGTGKEIGEALQGAAVDGAEKLNDALDKSVEKMLHLHGIAGDILNDFIKIGLEAAEKQLLGGLFSTGGGVASGGGLIGAIGGAIGNLAIPGFASGGGGIIGGNPGVDQNLLSLNGKPIARVGQGEQLSVSPNIGAANGKVVSQQSSVVIVQPIHADFSGARTDEQTMKQFQDYADQSSARAYQAAVTASGRQVAGIVQRKQTLGT